MIERARFAQKMDDFNRVASLPEQVAQITIGADFFACGVAKLYERSGIVNHKIWMHLERIFFVAMLAGELGRLFPVRNYPFVPLPFENLSEIRRPAIGGPIRRLVFRRTTGTS